MSNARTIILSARLGDFISIDSWLLPEERNAVERIFYVHRQVTYEAIRNSIDIRLVFPNIKQEFVIDRPWNNDTQWWHHWPKAHVVLNGHMTKLEDYFLNYNKEFGHIFEGTFSSLYKKMENYPRPPQGSTYLKHNLAVLNGRFMMPHNYVCIHPYSKYDQPTRDFTPADWNAVLRYLENKNLYGVIVGDQRINAPAIVPSHRRLTNLIGRTSLKEAIEIVKQSSQFIGCSSAFAVIASKVHSPENIHIRANRHLFDPQQWMEGNEVRTRPFWYLYFAPLTDKCIHENLEFLGNI